jgi:hypothetical protein
VRLHVLDQENHDEHHDAADGIHQELPMVRKMKSGPAVAQPIT